MVLQLDQIFEIPSNSLPKTSKFIDAFLLHMANNSCINFTNSIFNKSPILFNPTEKSIGEKSGELGNHSNSPRLRIFQHFTIC